MADERADVYDLLSTAIADGETIDWDNLPEEEKLTESEKRTYRVLETMRLLLGPVLSEAGMWEGEVLLKGYEILETLGETSNSKVYLARDLSLGREVALKILEGSPVQSEALRVSFVREARTLASLDHPNIVRIYSVDEDEGKIRLSLERIRGSNLEQVVKRDGPMAAEEAARVGLDLCAALSAIHGQSLVHLDLKPANVMRESGGRIVLLDFNVSSPVEPVGAETTSRGGTPLFMAPEQWEARGAVGSRTDIYALGVLLYWLVTGRYPYAHEGISDLREQVLAGNAIPLLDRRADIDGAFAELVSRAMARRPEDRFSSAGALSEALQDFLAPPKTEKRPMLLLITVFLAASLALVLGIRACSVDTPPFEVDTDLYVMRADAAGTPVPVRVTAGEPVRVGDQLFLEFATDRELQVYILNEDDNGHLAVIFPIPGFEPGNPVPPGTHRLPGKEEGESRSWEVNTPGGGSEVIVVIASEKPDEDVEALVKEISEATTLEKLSPESRDVLYRGIGGTAPRNEDASGEPEKNTRRLRDLLQNRDQEWKDETLYLTFFLTNDGRG